MNERVTYFPAWLTQVLIVVALLIVMTAPVRAHHLEALSEELIAFCAPQGVNRPAPVPAVCYGYLFAVLDIVSDGHLVVTDFYGLGASDTPKCAVAKEELSVEILHGYLLDEIEREDRPHRDIILFTRGHDLLIDLMITKNLVALETCVNHQPH